MRRLLAIATTGAMLAIFAVPVHAASPTPCAPPPPPGTMPAQTYTCTMHITDFIPPSMEVLPKTCPDGSQVPGGLLTVTIENGFFHLTVNTAGDAWDTSTSEGPFAFVGTDGITVSGHYMQWFGDSINNMNAVGHATLNFVGKTADGTLLILHVEFHISVNPNGNPTFFAKTHC